MAVKIRLSRKGRKKAPFYHIVVADARSPRDGKFIEKIGSYNPMTKPATIDIDRNAAFDWLTKGAQPTDTVKAIFRFKGVYYKKHLMRGVKKGALSLEQADTLLQQWIDSKESKISSRIEQTKSELEAFRKMVSGDVKPKKLVVDESTKEAAEVFKSTEAKVAEEAHVADVIEEATVVATEPETPVVAEEAHQEIAEVAEVPANDEVVSPTETEVEISPEVADSAEGDVDATAEDAVTEVPTEE